MKIQKELDETKIVLHKTIESVLERGEKIDTLVNKSNDLSSQSKAFYTQGMCFSCASLLLKWLLINSQQRSRTAAVWSCRRQVRQLPFGSRW